MKSSAGIPVAWRMMPLIWLIVAMCMGTLLRSFHVWPFAFVQYEHLLHGHSHTAMLGWVFSAITALAAAKIFPGLAQSSLIKGWFVLLQISIAGMAFAFPLQGYALWSITFSTMHMLLFYFLFVYCLKIYGLRDRSPVKILFFTAGACMIIASAGPWALGILSALKLQAHPLYTLSVQHFLHFLIEGWFVLSIAALLPLKNIQIPAGRSFFLHLFAYIASLILLFQIFVSAAFSYPWLQTVSLAGAIIQIAIFTSLFRYAGLQNPFNKGFMKQIFIFTLLLLFVKSMLQLYATLPFVNPEIILIQPFRIGYLHLVLLGIVSASLIMLFLREGWLKYHNTFAKFSLAAYWASLVLHVSLLFVQGLLVRAFLVSVPWYNEVLLITSLGMLAGIVGISINYKPILYHKIIQVNYGK